MSEKDTLVKGGRVVQASSVNHWCVAPRPNYAERGNTDLEFPYSEYPRERTHEFFSVRLPTHSSQILDFWGEGRINNDGMITGFPAAYNVNHQFQLVSNGADEGKKIPNRIPTVDYTTVSVEKYVPDGSFDTVTVMAAPITDQTAAEIARIVSSDVHALVVTYGFEEGDDNIVRLEHQLDSKGLVLLGGFKLSPPLNEITLAPSLAFCTIDGVVANAISSFVDKNMSACADILCTLGGSPKISAKTALKDFFSKDEVENSHTIFSLGYKLNETTNGRNVMDTYMNGNIVKIVRGTYKSIQLESNFGSVAKLFPDGRVSDGSWEYACFGTPDYIDARPSYKGGENFTLVPTESKEKFQIESGFGSTSYLCVNHSVPKDSWQRAFFGTPSFLQAPTYHDGQFFYLIPRSGGQEFTVQADLGETSYLCVGEVSASLWRWAFFGTQTYISSISYSEGQVMKLVIE